VNCDPNALMAAAACIDQQIPDGMKFPVIISLLQTIADNTQSPGDLMTNAACIDQQIPDGMKLAVFNSLLCQIAGI
jgi:hypothetical protein